MDIILDQSSEDLLCCRVCLMTDCKLFNIHEYKLADALSRISGTPIFKGRLPQYLCTYCHTLLLKCAKFRMMCLRTDQCLKKEVFKGELNTASIRRLDRVTNRLFHLTLTEVENVDVPPCEKINEPNNIDIGVPKIEQVYKVEPNTISIDDDTDDDETNYMDIEANMHTYKIKANTEDIDEANIKTDDNEDMDEPNTEDIDEANIKTDDNDDMDEPNTVEIDEEDAPNIHKVGIVKRNIDIGMQETRLNTVNIATIRKPELRMELEMLKGQLKIKVVKDAKVNNSPALKRIKPEMEAHKAKVNNVRSVAKRIKTGKENNTMMLPRIINTSEEKKVQIQIIKNSQDIFNNPGMLNPALVRKLNKESAVKRKRLWFPRGPANNYLQEFDYSKFERDHAVKIVTLTKQEQLEEIVARKQSATYAAAWFPCADCGKCFGMEAAYNNHRRRHSPSSGEYECDICSVRFKKRSHRQGHQDTHRLKFNCERCNFVSRSKHQAKAHYDMHEGKTFNCPHCGNTYNKQSTYFSHVRIAHPAANEACDLCGETFIGARGIYVHKQLMHKHAQYSDDDGLPQHLCPFCRLQLLRFADLRARCRRAQALLRQLSKRRFISTDDILSVDRHYHKLELNMVQMNVYSFNSLEPHMSHMSHSKPEHTFDDFDDRDIEVKDEIADPLEQPNIDETTYADESKSKRLVVEIDGLNLGNISVKNLEVSEKPKKSKKEDKAKTKRVSNLLRYVAGKKRNAKPLTKWQQQLRRADNNFLPNFDHAEFEAKHDCKLKILTMEEQLYEIDERKQSSNYLNLDYKCEQCGRGFEFEQPFRNHMAKHDPEIGKFECEVCHIHFRTQYLRHRHLDYHKMQFTCSVCGFITRAKHLARNHYLMHTGKVFKCKQCDATFTKSTSYYGHVRLNHPSKDHVCGICGDSFIGALGLRHHHAKAHKELSKAKFECKSCGVVFVSSEAMSAHTDGRTQCDANLKACAECGAVFGTEEALKSHADTHVFWCKECSQSFVSQSSLDTHHQRIHLRIKWPAYGRTREMNKEYYKKIKERTRLRAQVVCEICGAKLLSNAALERHQLGQCKREKNTKSYKCPFCEKSCATRQGLQLHVTLHTGEKPHKCAQCSREFRQAGALRRHTQAVHLGIDTRVQCATCGKSFSTPSTRALHVNSVHLRLPARRRKDP